MSSKIESNIVYTIFRDLFTKNLEKTFTAFQKKNPTLDLINVLQEAERMAKLYNEGPQLVAIILAMKLAKYYEANTLIIPEQYDLTIQANASYLSNKGTQFDKIFKMLMEGDMMVIINAFDKCNPTLKIMTFHWPKFVQAAAEEASILAKKEPSSSYTSLYKEILNMMMASFLETTFNESTLSIPKDYENIFN